MFNKPRIGIVGTGCTGCFIGALLAQAGCEVGFLRMPGESALKSGIRVKLPDRQVVLEKPEIHRSARALGRCQLILITSGTHANSELSKALPHLMHEDSLVVTLQGGLGNDEFLAGIIPAVNLLGGLNFVRIDSPEGGLIRVCLPGQFFLGEFMGSSRNRTLKLVQLFLIGMRAGVTDWRICPPGNL